MPTVTLNEGLAVFVLCWLGFAGWKFGWWIMYKLFGNDEKGTPGAVGDVIVLGRQFVTSAVSLHDTLKETQREQLVTCKAHITGYGTLEELIKDQVAIGVIAKDSAVKAAVQADKAATQAEVGNASLAHIDKVLQDRTPMLQGTHGDVAKLKQAALRACDLCRYVAASECPNSAATVNTHLVEIERIISEA